MNQPPSEALQIIARHEARVRPGWIAGFLRFVGRSAAFAAFYRVVGPPIDRFMLKRYKGWVGRAYGIPALLLVTTGARSGLPRSSPLLYVRDGDDFLVVGTNFGQASHPAWTGNLLARPEAVIEVGSARLEVTAAEVDRTAFEAQWPRFVEIYPGYNGYLERCGRVPRMFCLRARA